MVNFYQKKQKEKYKFKLNVESFLNKNDINYDFTSTGEITIESCPKCGKQDYKLYVEPETGVCQCKHASCDWVNGASPVDLVEGLLGCTRREAFLLCFDVPNENKSNSIFDDDEDEEPETFVSKKRQKEEIQNVELPLLSESLDKIKHSVAWNYLIGRGYSEEIISKLNLKIIPFLDYKEYWHILQTKHKVPVDLIKKNLRYLNRVIFPLYFNGEIKGYVARDFSGNVPKSQKVFNSEGSFRKEYFWNYDNVKNNKNELVICEGISDAVKCGIHRSIAVLGTAVADGQVDHIIDLKPEKIIFCLDIGTEAVQNSLYERLFLDFPGQIYVVDLEPYLYVNQDILNDEIKETLEATYGQLNKFSPTGFVLSYANWLDLKFKFQHDWFKLSNESKLLLEKFINSAQYKDAGDHSFEEMNELIKKAVPFSKKDVPDDKKK